MMKTFQTEAGTQSLLARHKRTLMAGVFGLGVLGLAAGDLLIEPTSPAIAASQTAQVAPTANTGFADIVDKVRPAVVSIKVKTAAPALMSDDGEGMSGQGEGSDQMERFFRQFGFGEGGGGHMMPHPQQPKRQFGMSQGSGFFISADGYIVTNNHVVDKGEEVDIVTEAGKTYTAKVIGTDPKTDLALLKVQEKGDFPYVEFANSAPRVGEWVIAVGNPFGLGGSVTAGIVSASDRDIGSGPYDDYIQIDAPVNRGNSGGPTFDTSGRVIGVNTAIFSPSGGSVGIGFAIPADVVQRVVADLKDDGQVTRGWIGVQIQPVTQDIADSIGLKSAQGAIVAEITGGSPAAKAGLKSGDAITAVNGTTVETPRDLARTIAGIKPGSDAKLTVWRDGKEMTVDVETGKLPGDKQAKADTQDENSDEGSSTSLASLGIGLAPASSVAGAGSKGVVVTEVDPDGAAAETLKPGDVIVDVAGKAVRQPSDVQEGIASVKAEGRRTVLMKVKNGDQVRFVALPVGKA
jgi:serine protease Do